MHLGAAVLENERLRNRVGALHRASQAGLGPQNCTWGEVGSVLQPDASRSSEKMPFLGGVSQVCGGGHGR